MLGKLLQFQIVGLGHVRKPGAEPFIVGANEGIRAHHVDEVGDEHQGAGSKVPVDAAAGVGQHHLFHFQGIDFFFAQSACQQSAFVPCHCGYREVGDVLVGQFLCVGKVCGQVSQPGPQHHRHLWAFGGVCLDVLCTFQCFFIKMFHSVFSFFM